MRSVQPGSTIAVPSLLWKQVVARRTRVLLKRDRHYEVSGREMTLPPGHLLPEFQRFAPTYDRYAGKLLEELSRPDGCALHLIDVGGNIGDTAILALEASPNITVTTVEGSEYFLTYLRDNLAGYGERVRIIDRFLEAPGAKGVYRHNGSTGGFVASEAEVGGGESGVSPAELLEREPAATRTVWKTDTDGYDLPLLAAHWAVVRQCEVIWFEFDPFMTRDGLLATDDMVGRLAESHPHLLVFDNFGRFMLSTKDPNVLIGLARWQAAIHDSVLPSARYFDVWAFSDADLARDVAQVALAAGS